jgi:hypothetical protein
LPSWWCSVTTRVTARALALPGHASAWASAGRWPGAGGAANSCRTGCASTWKSRAGTRRCAPCACGARPSSPWRRPCFFLPGNTGYIGRANLTDFEKSTLPLIKDLIPPELLVAHNSQKHFLDILSCDGVTVSRIWYGEMGDPGSLLSANLGWFAIDEAYEVPLETFVNLAGCLRGKLPNGQPRPFFGLMASNPAPAG